MTNEYFSKCCVKCKHRGSDVQGKNFNGDLSRDYKVEQYCYVVGDEEFETDIMGYFLPSWEFDKMIKDFKGAMLGGNFIGQEAKVVNAHIQEVCNECVVDMAFKVPMDCPYRLEFLVHDQKDTE